MQKNDVMVKQTVDQWLNSVDYAALNSNEYVPSVFSINYVNFIKLVNGDQGESHKSPVIHLRMLDELAGKRTRLANLCSRGIAKTTLFGEYLSLYIALYGEIDGFGKIEGMIYVSDSMENGVKSFRKNVEYRYNNSEFLQKYIPEAKFTDAYIEFTNADGHKLGIRMFGAKALSLDTELYLASGGTTTIGECSVGDVIIGADGKPTIITRKSEVFHKPMYELLLDDGRTLKVSNDHLNQVWLKNFNGSNKPTYEEHTLTTDELLKLPLVKVDANGHKRPLIWVQDCKPIEFEENTDQLIDAYTVGVLLGDGSMNAKSSGNVPVVLTAHEDDWPTYEKELPYPLGKMYRDKRNPTTISRTVLGINRFVSMHGLDTHGNFKKIPDEYLYGSVEQRLALLQGLMDTDGACSADGKSTFSSNSKTLVEQVMFLSRSLGGQARWVSTGKDTHYKAAVRINMPMFRLERKLVRQRPPRMDKISIVSITPIADEPSQCIAVDNEERQFVAGKGLVRTHNTGLRGTKIFGKRPVLAVLDDLVSDDDAKSKSVMQAIKDTVYKGVDYALDPSRRKIVFCGTPFNKNDILYEAVESGGWYVNVFPICEKFPCSREEFVGAWEDRFPYEFVKEQYDLAVATGQVAAFNQELMLRITSDEERLVLEDEIRWYKRKSLLANKSNFNFYITTDFATSERAAGDFSVISVWAYNNNGDWFWVDGICRRQLMDKNLDDLFRLVVEYSPQAVGIEVSGQQNGFVNWIQERMLQTNIFFNLASDGNGSKPGIRPAAGKMVRFNTVLPWFKAGKMYFPEEMKTTPLMLECLDELRMATIEGFKSKHDDFIDTISMLGCLKPWKPSQASVMTPMEDSVWDIPDHDTRGGIDSYLV
ncbi:MAG: hypothetical protein ACRDCE_11300 [Cetobacterium sp.]|uniref:hypothetical protein n=1 Tax=Cetobacterium sp. TaxID=2071632 RepID=UPI003EE70F64